MPAPEQAAQPRPLEVPPTDYRELGTRPPTSPRMEQVVTQLAAAYHLDMSQAGANFNLDLPNQPQRWMIANIDGDRIGVTRCQMTEENLLAPDLDMIFAVTEFGWEPREIVHAERPWDEFAQAAQEQDLTVFDPQGNLR